MGSQGLHQDEGPGKQRPDYSPDHAGYQEWVTRVYDRMKVQVSRTDYSMYLPCYTGLTRGDPHNTDSGYCLTPRWEAQNSIIYVHVLLFTWHCRPMLKILSFV
jgi:hypothetical protein